MNFNIEYKKKKILIRKISFVLSQTNFLISLEANLIKQYFMIR